MGGIGSGRQAHRNTATAEEFKRIDIRYLKRIGILGKYRSGTLSWTCNGQQSGFINYASSPQTLTLEFRFRRYGEDWQPVTQHIQFVDSLCNYGGSRKWLECPKCERRCGVLYAGGPRFLCRTCYQIPYTSQTKGPIDRMIHRMHNLEARIFDETGYRKRKGMHWRTFERLLQQRDKLSSRIDADIYKFCSEHLEGIPRGGYSQ
ncbi:hypothetical protein Kalk_08595 [Ketobacter alkanivorans]|uniref:Uncharacterized protein n=1 Tax=Ketobacter alkanivorans TaxID=1917421 RepID=A0A2K9LNU8_9GAMM|nr:hypothetical protein Kalk_08595 [Ketobacter alkanivorans]